MREISDLLTQSLRRHGIERQVTTAQIVEVAEALIQRALSPAAKEDVRVISFFGDALRVACRHPAAGGELRRLKPAILADLARSFPRKTIRDIETLIDERVFRV